jgi:hypothetical protein
MVCLHQHSEAGSLEVVAPGLEGFHNGKHFFFMDTVILLGVSKLAAQEGHRVESLAVVLLEDGAERIVGGVRANNKRVGGVRECQDGGTGKGRPQGCEGGCVGRGPAPRGTGGKQVRERGGDVRKAPDEVPVKPSQAEELTQVLDVATSIGVCGPIGSYLGGKGLDAIRSDHVTQVFSGGAVKLAFGGGGKQ